MTLSLKENFHVSTQRPPLRWGPTGDVISGLAGVGTKCDLLLNGSSPAEVLIAHLTIGEDTNIVTVDGRGDQVSCVLEDVDLVVAAFFRSRPHLDKTDRAFSANGT